LEQTIGPRVIDEITGTDTAHALPLNFCDRTPHRVAPVRYRRRDGSFLRADLVRTPLYEQGRQVGVVDVFSDRSEQYRAQAALQDSEARLRAFIDAAPDAMVVIAASGRITFANEEAARLTGYSVGELRDAPAEMLVPQEYRSKHLVKRALGSPAGADHELEARAETILLQKSGARLPVEIRLAHFSTHEGRFVVTIARDVSVRKAAEAQLRELAETLERRVKLRTATLERAYRDLESFSYTVAHDLRAPLRSINGFTQLVLQGEGERFSASGRELFERVIRNARKMDELIEDILRYSRSATGRVELREVDMHALVTSVLPELTEPHPQALIELLDLPRIQGDAAMLRQVWINLIGNALKFSAVRERPRVEIGCRRAQECVFYVADNGVGFDMAHADRLFGMFQRMHAGEQFSGTGVGLAIVRRLIERQGGQIWVKAEPGQGATFYFTLGSCADPAVAAIDPPASGDDHPGFPS
jgi:PAS domain S-box-containing protein